MDFFVHPILDGLVARDQIYCNVADFSEETVRVHWPHSCDALCTNDCGCCKPTIARQLTRPGDDVIVIGDSVTDFEIAKQADFVYARGNSSCYVKRKASRIIRSRRLTISRII